MHGGLGDGDADADVPGAVRVGGREAVVVDYEAADGDACCDPTQRHDDDDEHLCLAVHLKIPDHDRRDGDDDDVHEDTEGAGREDECARVDALASRDDFAVGSYSVHGGSTPCVFDR